MARRSLVVWATIRHNRWKLPLSPDRLARTAFSMY